MKLVTFAHRSDGAARLGALWEDRIVDLPAHCAARGQIIPATLLEFIQAGGPARQAARNALLEAPSSLHVQPVAESRLFAPIPRPGKILCSGINYHSHFTENPTAKFPSEPFFFAKMPSVVIGPEAPIVLPPGSLQIDYEVEMAVVIGHRLSRAREDEVRPAIFGYTILNDISARVVQFKENQITLGKNFDTFCPLGPAVVTEDEIPHPETLQLRTRVNGELRQDGSNRDWIFPLPGFLARLSHVMTLEPGDIVTTGTPAGVGLFRKPPVYLKHGDVVELEIEGIGTLRNPVTNDLQGDFNR